MPLPRLVGQSFLVAVWICMVSEVVQQLLLLTLVEEVGEAAGEVFTTESGFQGQANHKSL
jgi:hypothetical protein